MTKEQLAKILDRLYGIDKHNQLKNMENAGIILAELNPPAAPAPKTADGVEVKDGDKVYMVNKRDDLDNQLWVQVTVGPAKHGGCGLTVIVDGTPYIQDDEWPIFYTFPAACKHIATLLGVEHPEIKPLPPMDLEDEVEPAETEPMVPLRDVGLLLSMNTPMHEKTAKLTEWTNNGWIQWKAEKGGWNRGYVFGSQIYGINDDSPGRDPFLAAIRSQIDARGKDGEDEGWVGEHFDGCGKHWWIGKNGMCSDLSSVKPYETNLADRFIESHLIPLSAARKIEEERLRKDDGKWVSYCWSTGNFYGRSGIAVPRLDQATIFTELSPIELEKEIGGWKYIPLSEAREIERKRLEEEGGK